MGYGWVGTSAARGPIRRRLSLLLDAPGEVIKRAAMSIRPRETDAPIGRPGLYCRAPSADGGTDISNVGEAAASALNRVAESVDSRLQDWDHRL